MCAVELGLSLGSLPPEPASQNGFAVLFPETPSSLAVLRMWFHILSLGIALLSSSSPALGGSENVFPVPLRRSGVGFDTACWMGTSQWQKLGVPIGLEVVGVAWLAGEAVWAGTRQVGQAAAGGDPHLLVWERTVRGRAPSGTRRPQVALTYPPLFPRCPAPREDYGSGGT